MRTADGGIRAEIAVANTGAREGWEVVQFYVARPDSRVERPVKELKAFAKVSLAPGESRKVSVTISLRDLQHWDETQSAFTVEPGRVEILAGTSSSDIAERTFVPDAVAYFKPGERISFFGDSIVHGGWFEHLLGLFAALRDPGSNVRITNVGISGDTAGGGLERFDWDLLPTKPDRVFTFFGMNDVGRGDYRTKTPDEATRKRRAASLERYRANQAKLADRLAAAGIGQVCLTPSPYDEYSAIRTTNLAAVNSQGLSRCAEIVRDLAADRGLPLADIHPSLTSVFAADTTSSLTGDRVHPGCSGHLMMMAEILAAMGVSPTVAETTVAAAGDGASFDYAPKALPFPKSWYYEQAEKRYSLTERINREIVRVTGLPPGKYDLAFDGRTVAAFTADEFAAGVNVALLDTPNQRTAQSAWKLMCGIKDTESALRDIALVRCQLLAAKVDPDDWAAADAHLDARLQKLREQKAGNLGYYEGVYAKYRKCRGEVAALMAKADGLRAEMNALRPAVSQVSIQRKVK